VASNGLEAVEFVSNQEFDVVLMDVQMPEMDGIAAAKAIRTEEAKKCAKAIPIIALTAHVMEEDRRRCTEAGMDGYLSKPLRPTELQRELARLLEDDGEAGTEAVESERPEAVADSDDSLVDWVHARKSTLDDDDLLNDVISAVLEELPDLIGSLDTALAAFAYKDVYRMAHTVKGALRTFGAVFPMSQCEKIESLARSEDLSSVGESVETLKRAVDRVISELRQFTSAAENG
jgi:CheY-like chemotaxis protein/HPt (histidine-containing phosphotransfer) domain-containing protein